MHSVGVGRGNNRDLEPVERSLHLRTDKDDVAGVVHALYPGRVLRWRGGMGRKKGGTQQGITPYE